jgi:signal transduction histidine kinase
VLADPVRLRQVLANLLSNAVRFTERGEIRVTARIVDQEKDAVTVRFSVCDTGIGIGPDKLDKIFGEFTQADNSDTRRYGGAGLGLSIASKLVAAMGGRISVQSKLNEGSTFWFSLRFQTVPTAQLSIA